MNLMFSQPKQKVVKSQYYAMVDGNQAGPMSEAELKILIKNGSVTPETMIWMPSLPQWTQARMIPAINKLLLFVSHHKDCNTSLFKQTTTISSNPLKIDIIAALKQLGFSPTAMSGKVDVLLENNPNITIEEAIKQLLRAQ